MDNANDTEDSGVVLDPFSFGPQLESKICQLKRIEPICLIDNSHNFCALCERTHSIHSFLKALEDFCLKISFS